jgi:geranylgeranyl reductase family protein
VTVPSDADFPVDDESDVLVVGGGPAGSSVAIRLAAAGHSVTLVEKRDSSQSKACGDTATPRAIAELAALGIEPDDLPHHRVLGVEMRHGSRSRPIPWPDHSELPSDGLVIRRDLFDERLRLAAADAGARVLNGHEATTPIIERGFVRGAQLTATDGSTCSAHARFVVVADGAASRFGRVLGTTRDHRWPYAIATRTYFGSPRTDHPWIEATLGLADANGAPIAGYGWVVPVGDGTVNVGIGVLSTASEVKRINTLKLLDAFTASVADRWRFDAGSPLDSPTRHRIPLGGSVDPKMGPTFLVVGDAAGAANPFSGVGISTALMTGRLAATALDDAIVTGSAAALQRYPTLLTDEVGRYYKVGRLTARFLGRPSVLGPLLRLGTRSDKVMGGMLRIAGNELRSVDSGGTERAYAIAAAVSKLAPSW